jgi:hypothetical protein
VIQFQDGSVVGTTGDAKVTIQRGHNQADFVVKGLAEGHTSYTITMTDSQYNTCANSGIINVGNGYKILPNPVGSTPDSPSRTRCRGAPSW